MPRAFAVALALALASACGGDDTMDASDDMSAGESSSGGEPISEVELTCQDAVECAQSDCFDPLVALTKCLDETDQCFMESEAFDACALNCGSACEGEGCEAANAHGVCHVKDCAAPEVDCAPTAERCAGIDIAAEPVEC
ncbi:MAG: hypothetical protein AAF721_00470 [Myxococcota bacterium]